MRTIQQIARDENFDFDDDAFKRVRRALRKHLHEHALTSRHANAVRVAHVHRDRHVYDDDDAKFVVAIMRDVANAHTARRDATRDIRRSHARSNERVTIDDLRAQRELIDAHIRDRERNERIARDFDAMCADANDVE